MKIAIDIRSVMEGRQSGVEHYTTSIIRAMLRAAPGHEYHLFYNSARPVTLPVFAASKSGSLEVHSFRYPNKVFNALQWAGGQPRWDRLLTAAQPDVFFVPALRLVPLAPQVPLVTTWHDLSFERFPEFFDDRRRLWHRLMRPRGLAERSDHLIAVSEHTKQDLVELYGIEEGKISVIYSGVGMAMGPVSADFPRATASARAGEPAGAPRGTPQPSHPSRIRLPKKFILYLGTLEPRKNIPSLIRAFSAVAKDVEHDLVLAGSVGWNMDEIEEAMRESLVRERIHFPGFIPEEDKAALYVAADLFVYPSLYEGFGFPPLEALLAGTPVITSFNSALPEVVGEWATLVDPYDVAGLALVMKELLTDESRVSPTAQTEIQRRYSWERAAQETLRVIENVVK